MKKISLIFILILSLGFNAQAQLLKKLKDKINNSITKNQGQEESKSFGGKFKEVTNVAALFAANAFTKAEGKANLGNADKSQQYYWDNYNKYYPHTMVFEPNGQIYLVEGTSAPKANASYKYKLDGSNIEYTVPDDKGSLLTHKGKILSNGSVIKIVHEILGGTMDIIYTYEARKGMTAVDMSRISASNDVTVVFAKDMPDKPLYIDRSIDEVNIDDRWNYYGIDGEYLTYYQPNYGGFDYVKIPFDKINVNETKIVREDPYYYIKVAYEGTVNFEKHYNSSWNLNAANPFPLIFDRWQCDEAVAALDKIINKLSKEKQAIFAKTKAERTAAIANWKKEDVASLNRFSASTANTPAESLKESSNSTPSNSNNSAPKAKTKFYVALRNKSNNPIDIVIHSKKGGSRTETTLNSRNSRRFEVEVGGKVTNKSGGVLVNITEGMEDQEIVIAQ
jgi:hypothetical protein